MKKLIATLLATASFTFCLYTHAATSVAVFDFETSKNGASSEQQSSLFGNKNVSQDSLGSEISILLTAYLSAEDDLLLVERTELQKILEEQELGLSGLASPDTVAQVGYLTGAKVLVTGRTFEAGNKRLAVARIISVETSRTFAETVSYKNASEIDKAAEELAQKIAKTITAKKEALVITPKKADDQIKELKQYVEGKELPTVGISIPEEHITRSVPDPAVETELRLILGKLGFEIIDLEKSSVTPDILISGEAFSEVAARKNNLISCRARVEIKINDKDGNHLMSDREVGVAVDLAESIAAKEALASSARELANRIVPAIVK